MNRKHLMQLEAVLLCNTITYGGPPGPPAEQVKTNPKGHYKTKDKSTQFFRRGGRG